MVAKLKFGMLVFLMATGMAVAAETLEMNAILIDDKPLAGPNCRMQGGPTSYVIDVSVANPSADNSLRVGYMYYNSSLGDYVDGGKICDVKPSLREICTVTIYTITGGKNGTEQFPFKLSGTYDTESYCGGPFCSAKISYAKEFNIPVNHYTGVYEENVVKKINSARTEYDTAVQRYTGCSNASVLDLLQTAYSEILVAQEKLTICDMAKAQNMTNDAILKIREVESYPKAGVCGGNPPQQNNTGNTSVPSDDNVTQDNETTDQPQFNLTNNTNITGPAGTDNISNVTLAIAKGCMPFFILTGILVAAVWSERRTSA